MLRGFPDLRVNNPAFKLAMDIFELTKPFPSDERYSLTSRIPRSSRSVAANIA
jgi:four helix bundle protein